MYFWTTDDLIVGFAHERVYDTFIALVYTAMAYMPQRFKPGQPPFHVVTHQRDYLALRCSKDVPRGGDVPPHACVHYSHLVF